MPYARSTDGNNADDGLSWANAKADLHGPTWAAGDFVYVSQVHAQVGAAATAITITTNGTAASPTKIVCANDAAEPPTAAATGATVTSSTSGGIRVDGYCYVYGIEFVCGSGANPTVLALNSAASAQAQQSYEDCKFALRATSPTARIGIGVGAGTNCAVITWANCEAKFANASQAIAFSNVRFRWNGGSITAGGTDLTGSLFKLNGAGTGRMVELNLSGVDLGNLGAACSIFDATAAQKSVIRSSKLPASWTGGLATGTAVPGFHAEMYDCASGDTHHSFWVEGYAGSVREESTIVRTGGASRSQKFVTGANAEFPAVPLYGPEVCIPNTATGSSVTVEAEIVTDNVTLTDAEAYIEVFAKTTSGSTQATLYRDVVASILATPANQSSSSETWTTTGLTTPVKQKLSVTFTPQEEGAFMARVVLCKASTTVYADPPRKI